MGKFLEEIRNDKKDRSILARLKDQMKPDEYNDLLEAIKDSTISSGAIQRALNKRGYVVSVSALSSARRSQK